MTERLTPQTVLCNGQYAVVLQTIAHPAGTHPDSPIRNDLVGVELVTERGSRWYGFERAWIGSDLRMHVAPVDPRAEVVLAWEQLS